MRPSSKQVPFHILERNKNITTGANIFFTNKLLFFTTLRQHVLFTTVPHLTNRKAKSILSAIIVVKNLYLMRGFRLVRVNVENECINLSDECMHHGIILNVAATNELVPAIEKRIRVIKERV